MDNKQENDEILEKSREIGGLSSDVDSITVDDIDIHRKYTRKQQDDVKIDNHKEKSKRTPEQIIEDKKFIYYVISYTLVSVIAAVSRFVKINFSDTGTPVFDEKHYAPQATQMLYNGGMENNPGYGLVVHPPLGKMLISIGEKIFGYTPLGWRFSSVIAGILITLLLCFITHKVTKSPLLIFFTGVLATTEGIMFTMSRAAMLDIFQSLFITGIFMCTVFYIYSNYEKRRVPWHQRYWLLGVCIFSGLALCIKISGIYYPFVFGVCLVIYTFFAQREYTVENHKKIYESLFSKKRIWNLFKCIGFGLFSLLVIPVSMFLLSYANWFRNETAWDRHAIEQGTNYFQFPNWVVNTFPNGLLNFFSMYADILQFHTSLTTSKGNTHPWESKPWQWLFGDKPMLFMTQNNADGLKSEIWLFGNMGVWLLLVFVLIYGIYRIMNKDRMWTVTIIGFFTGFVPWVIAYDRQMYLFYAAPLAPFVVIMYILLIRDITGLINTKSNTERMTMWTAIVGTLIVLPSVIVFVYYIPILYGVFVSDDKLESFKVFHTWMQIDDSKKNYGIDSIGIVKKIKDIFTQ